MNPKRDTTTGSNYEQIIEMCLKRSCEMTGMMARSQVTVGDKPGGGKHRVDWELALVDDPEIRGLVSCKFQGTSGTAEEKIAYEVIKLLHTMENDLRYKKSWIIMGGDGWSPGMKGFVNSELKKWVPAMVGKVSIFTTDQLINKNLSLT
jgi:hypothetical protein